MSGNFRPLLYLTALAIFMCGQIRSEDEHQIDKRATTYKYGPPQPAPPPAPFYAPTYPMNPPQIPYYAYPPMYPPPPMYTNYNYAPTPYKPSNGNNGTSGGGGSSNPPPAPQNTDGQNCELNDPAPSNGCLCTEDFNPTECEIQNCKAGDTPGNREGYTCYCNGVASPSDCVTPDGNAPSCEATPVPSPCTCSGAGGSFKPDGCQLGECDQFDTPRNSFTCVCSGALRPPHCVTTTTLTTTLAASNNGLVLASLLSDSGLNLDDLSSNNALALVSVLGDDGLLLDGDNLKGLSDTLGGSLLSADIANGIVLGGLFRRLNI